MSAFTSNLSVADFALCHQVQLTPISQVLGSSIYQVGYQPTMFGYGAGSEAGELQVISQAWNDARDLAFARLSEEAEKVGASAVIGVQIRSGTGGIAAASGIQSIEYTVLGTAVRREGAHSLKPRITELSVADYRKLLQAQIEPVGVVAYTSVFFVSGLYLRAEQPFALGSTMQNYELRGITQAFYAAREQVMREIGAQARALKATGIVGVRIGHNAAPLTIGGGGFGEQQRTVVMVTMSAIGTAMDHSEARIDAGIGAGVGIGAGPGLGISVGTSTSIPAAASGEPSLKTTIDLLS